jgi:hypothetical protein
MIRIEESRVYSQNGEDGVIAALFHAIGETNRYFVEFGCESGYQRNTRWLESQGWSGLLMSHDMHDTPFDIKHEHITVENVSDLFAKYRVPAEFDLLSIDIDGNDYWIWKALSPDYRPRVVVIEYNGLLDSATSKAIPYDPDFLWNGSDYFGASLTALAELGASKGYVLVHCEAAGVNAFFVRSDELPKDFDQCSVGTLYRPLHKSYPHQEGEWVSCSTNSEVP